MPSNMPKMTCEICLGDFSLKDELGLGRPSDVIDEVLRNMIRTNPTLTSTEVDFSLKDELGLGRPSGAIDEVLRSMIRTNPTLTSTEVGFQLGIHQTAALDYIKRLDSVSKLSVCVPHGKFCPNSMGRISICSSNRDHYRRESVLDHLVIRDEKEIVYKHIFTKRRLHHPHPKLSASEEGYVVLLVSKGGLVHYEFLKENKRS
ncbi:hypothetical protein TNCV_4894071 [Trichonephila clavipes]|nr:hypothetical protein TNCV_4894071 [Trichonephila clavipes]